MGQGEAPTLLADRVPPGSEQPVGSSPRSARSLFLLLTNVPHDLFSHEIYKHQHSFSERTKCVHFHVHVDYSTYFSELFKAETKYYR